MASWRAPTEQRRIVVRLNCCDYFAGLYANGRKVWLRATGVIVASILTCHVTGASAISLTSARNESQAKRYCPADVVVWLDFRRRSTTRNGSDDTAAVLLEVFACREEARSSHYRRSLPSCSGRCTT